MIGWHTSQSTANCFSLLSLPTEWWQSVDVILQSESGTHPPAWPEDSRDVQLWSWDSSWMELGTQDWGSPFTLAFFLRALKCANTSTGSAIRLVFPSESGYLVRSDILSLRMVDLEPVESTVSFVATPGKPFGPLLIDSNTAPIFPHAIMNSTVGGILLRTPSAHEDYQDLFRQLDDEFTNRLSFPWHLASPPQRKTLAIVEGGRTGPDHGGLATGIYAAADALNIDMIVLDVPGHWLEGPKYASWRKEFVPVELEPPSLLADRIVEALSRFNVDGIVTFCDSYQVPVAQAAKRLRLPTHPPEAYEIATDKHRTAVSEGRPAYRVHNLEEAFDIVDRENLVYPFIIKPCKGFLSEGVFKVHGPEELSHAISNIHLDRHGTEVVLEAYCDGPKVDINLVLSEGELVFCEVTDDFPKTADEDSETTESTGQLKSFLELTCVMPSKLPTSEIDLLRNSLHQSLLRLGLTTGIYHVEARVQHSSMEYGKSDAATALVDLIPLVNPDEKKPSVWLIEINPRFPGIQETVAVESAYGVDYRGIGLLAGLRDHDRLRALAQPFRQGPQYWTQIVCIPVPIEGTFDSDDVCVELKQRRPDFARQICMSACFVKRGDRVYGLESGINSWVAYFNVFSRISRQHALGLGETVRRETRFTII
ncbi:hypothetical protein BO94DRAFT_563698 [Aspergillus sclerotioniger CBS 115572]|uniref:ATP-grasp domain-containing protein n=1 Tax=Aspergillus sclerotioniger CBS 115572 TaxID=1450535 RepID=A0A317X9D2_9EURO|nr:hypothetical protein BO94DRAFT_563698 [Aspergillus sclerotioniger CBS 115572]PWY94242.1 hypothetical protein BO94DRAFT_563698 [Aspergillus sclerotioniger CBS 115572]